MNRLRTYPCLVLLALAAALTIPASAQKPNFSGTWRLNITKSFLAADHPSPESQLTKIIEQKGDEVTMTEVAIHQAMANIPEPDSKITTTLIPDGKERELQTVSVFPGMPAPILKVAAEWQGGTLSVNERGYSFAGFTTTRRRYYLSEDGSQLIELVEGHTSYGDTEQRLIFDKQP